MKRTHGGCVAAQGQRQGHRAALLSAIVLVATLVLPVRASADPLEPTLAPDESLQIVSADVVVYGGTPGGVVAAVAAARAGARVVLVEPRTHVGGMIANGLGWTDRGDVGVIGGVAAEFFERARQIEGSPDGVWTVRPSTASGLFTTMLSEAGVIVRLGQRLVRPGGVTVSAGRIIEIRTTTGDAYRGDVFIDATYEGDLVAGAGVSFRVGREGRTEYGESRAGVRPSSPVMDVPPGMDPGFPTAAPGPVGSADNRIQGSNYRACLSSDTSNQVPFPRPGGYDPGRYEIVLQYIAQKVASGHTPTRTWFLHVGSLGDGKWDLNETGSVSFGLPGANTDYPNGSYARRAEIDAVHREYQKGFLYFLRNDPRVPVEIRSWMARFGLCADEFTDNGNWPRMLYLREGRRMVGRYVGTQEDLEALISKPDAIGLASYRLDAHNVSRWIGEDGQLRVEGGLGSTTYQRWSIPYRSLTPQQHEAANLLVPVAASVSHVAHASLRMEPQFMIMGQAAGTAAALAAVRGIAVQSVPIAELQAMLRADGAVLDDPGDIANSFYEAVAWAYHEGITSGCSKGHFCPNSPLRRDQMAALLARALDLPLASEDFFLDDAGNSHEDDINRLASAGISFGCSSQRYCPSSVVSREQMAGFLARALALEPTDIDFFTDDEASTHEVSINRLAASGITSGCTATLFCPKAIVTRGQTMAFLYRHYEGGPSGGWSPPEPTVTDGSPGPGPAGAPTPTPAPSASPQPTGTPMPTPSPAPSPTPGSSTSPSPSAQPSVSPPAPSPSP